MFQLATHGGFIGEITTDSFMKREFGKVLVCEVLAQRHLTEIISTSTAHIPGHGTATVLLFARNQPAGTEAVRVTMSKRGEAGRPAVPAQGKVWVSILEGHSTPGYESEFISVANVSRQALAAHPWSIGGGGAAELKTQLENRSSAQLRTITDAIGFSLILGEDQAYLWPTGRASIEHLPTIPVVAGEDVRDWMIKPNEVALCPFAGEDFHLAPPQRLLWALWPFRSSLKNRVVSGSTTMAQARREWFDYRRLSRDKLRATCSISFAFKATHNHFSLDLGGKLFNRTAPVVKLPVSAGPRLHFVTIAHLNSSTGCFWIKQVVQCLGAQGINEGMKTEKWEQFYEHDGGKLESFPLIAIEHAQLESFAQKLDALARERLTDSPRSAINTGTSAGPTGLRPSLRSRRERDLARLFKMVALQEELDWLCYKLYGIDPDAEIRDPENVPTLRPGLRPFEITLAQEDADRLAALTRGEKPDEKPTAWFTRHGWEPHLSLDSLSPKDRRISEARIERTAASRDLALVEQPTYKRRWYMPKYDEEEREAMTLWLADKVEAWVKDRKEPFTVRQAAAALRADPGLLAVGELLTGRPDFDVDTLVGDLIRADAVPNLKHHVFKLDGLLKRAAWEETWRLQHEEDAGKTVTPPVPPRYERTDYLKPEYWPLRGKLDVPKERFIAFTEVPPPTGEELLYGWAGWTHKERAHVMLALDEQLEGAGVKVPDRYGVLYGVWFLLPYVAWEAPDAARDFRADVKSLVGESGVTEAMLTDWAERFPLTKPRAAPRGKKAAK
jgi:hypothetical protein